MPPINALPVIPLVSGPVQAVAAVMVDTTGQAIDNGTADMTAAIGDPTDAAWNGTDPSATVISLLKAIALNTAP